MISTLQELIAPSANSEFCEMLRKRALVFRRATDEKKLANLFDWDTFRSVVENSCPPDKLCVTRDGEPVMPHIYLERGRVNSKNLARLLDHGASVIAVPIEAYVPQVAALCADMRRYAAEKIYAGAVATTGKGCAVKLHFDPQDIIVLQIVGSKRWKIYDAPISFPVVGMAEQAPPHNEPVFDETLRPGDFLFVPAGHWHHCENGPDRSLHLGILIEPPTGWHAFKALLPQIMAEEMFRLPLTRVGSPAEKAAHEVALKRRLIQKVEQISFSHFFEEEENPQGPSEHKTYP